MVRLFRIAHLSIPAIAGLATSAYAASQISWSTVQYGVIPLLGVTGLGSLMAALGSMVMSWATRDDFHGQMADTYGVTAVVALVGAGMLLLCV